MVSAAAAAVVAELAWEMACAAIDATAQKWRQMRQGESAQEACTICGILLSIIHTAVDISPLQDPQQACEQDVGVDCSAQRARERARHAAQQQQRHH
jgi:hypothetical protein